MKKILPASLALLMAFLPVAAKKTLDHSSFDDWKSVRNYSLSNSGEWAAYAVNPQEGDGVLTVRNTKTGKSVDIQRGYNPSFTADSKWAVVQIKPLFADTRKAKIDKKKDFDMPQDSLAIVNLKTMSVEKIPSVISYKIGKEGGEWLAYQSCDTTLISPKGLKEKKAGRPVVIRHLPSSTSKTVNWASQYVISKDGSKIALTLKKMKNDSTATDGIGFINLPDTSLTLVDRDKPFYGTPVFNEAGTNLAYTASTDTVESGTRRALLYLVDLDKSNPDPQEIDVFTTVGKGPNFQRPHSKDPKKQKELMEKWGEMQKESRGTTLSLNQYSVPKFSHDGRRLVIGVAAPVAPDDTTIVDFERADLDIWRWDAPITPPQEKKIVEKLRKHTFPMVIDLQGLTMRLVTDNPLAEIEAPNRWDSDWALVADPTENVISRQWDYFAKSNIKLFNVTNGHSHEVGNFCKDLVELSPADKYVVYFDKRNYYSYEVESGEVRNISAKVPYPLWDETDDHPMDPEPYGIAAWDADDKSVLVYDRWDIWQLDPSGVNDPVCITAGNGRKLSRRYRYEKTDPEKRFLEKGNVMLLTVFDQTDKRNGFATIKYGSVAAPDLRILDTYTFTQLRQAKNAPVFTYQRANFSTSPDIWLAKDYNFAKAQRLTDANPQMAEYNWGTARLEKWYTYDGAESEGVLYVPEDFDPSKKYPMLCVFYETGSEDLYRHYTMEPSWSWVNYPFYVSRGYVVFVPDIHYASGVPGECAYNYVCSGAEEMCKRYPWIDKDRIGIDGQSWGGYQTAYLVTRTNMFACAGSGAPVANMTSAFGGIRWGTGDSRQAQYEMGQSRIGRNLWDAPELYIANSPVFHANRVNTPLLIMHNDNDGAVPWYQGIEMFMALRRLSKPVWMLNYNGEEHNIIDRKNRKDITIRLQQFFDHYLKGEPMPKWMRYGIPATRKGQEMGTELLPTEE